MYCNKLRDRMALKWPQCVACAITKRIIKFTSCLLDISSSEMSNKQDASMSFYTLLVLHYLFYGRIFNRHKHLNSLIKYEMSQKMSSPRHWLPYSLLELAFNKPQLRHSSCPMQFFTEINKLLYIYVVFKTLNVLKKTNILCKLVYF